MKNIIDLPNFLSASTSPSVDVAATCSYSTSGHVAAANPAPGMALTHEQNSEPFFIPSFLHCARPAHDAIKTELVGAVIPIAPANNVATGESAC